VILGIVAHQILQTENCLLIWSLSGRLPQMHQPKFANQYQNVLERQ
jgi:hypothetical protein